MIFKVCGWPGIRCFSFQARVPSSRSPGYCGIVVKQRQASLGEFSIKSLCTQGKCIDTLAPIVFSGSLLKGKGQ